MCSCMKCPWGTAIIFPESGQMLDVPEEEELSLPFRFLTDIDSWIKIAAEPIIGKFEVGRKRKSVVGVSATRVVGRCGLRLYKPEMFLDGPLIGFIYIWCCPTF